MKRGEKDVPAREAGRRGGEKNWGKKGGGGMLSQKNSNSNKGEGKKKGKD